MDSDLLLRRTEELVAIEAVDGRPEKLGEALDRVLSWLAPGRTAERFEKNGKPSASVYAGTTRRRFRVILNGHLDVVPGAPEQFRSRRTAGLWFRSCALPVRRVGLHLDADPGMR